MARPENLDQSAFFLKGGPVGVLLIHGFTGAAVEMRLIGDYLHDRGFTVFAPLLPGHGTEMEDLNRRKKEEWVQAVNVSLDKLMTHASQTFVVGYSLGSLLALHLATTRSNLTGVIAIAPPLALEGWRRRVLRLAMPFLSQIPSFGEPYFADPEAQSRLWHYDAYPAKAAGEVLALVREVKQAIPLVTCPLLVIHSSGDRRAKSTGAIEAFETAGSDDKEILELNKSGHAITVDVEWEIVAERIYQFISHRAPTDA